MWFPSDKTEALDRFRKSEADEAQAAKEAAARVKTKWTKCRRTVTGAEVRFAHDEGTGKFPLWFEYTGGEKAHGPIWRYSRDGRALQGSDLDPMSVPEYER